MKKQKVHFSIYRSISVTACGANCFCDFSGDLKVTNRRDRVTCKNCKATKRFRRVK